MINTLRIAREVLVKGRSHEEVARELGIAPRTIRRHLTLARKSGMINLFVAPPLHSEEVIDLQIELKTQFGLKDALVVQGQEGLIEGENSPEREAVLLSCCFRAAQYLALSLKDGDTLAVPWGRVATYIAGYLAPKKKLPNLTVVPMVGVMDIDSNPYEANIIATKIASVFGGKHLMLAAPAVLKEEHHKTVIEIPLVKRALRTLAEANVVVTPIAAPNPQTSTIVRKGLATRNEVEHMIRLGAVGEIASHWWFDKYGRHIPRPTNMLPIGLGLDGLRRVLERNRGRVIGVIAGSHERLIPTRVALNEGLVNVLVTDHLSARELLS